MPQVVALDDYVRQRQEIIDGWTVVRAICDPGLSYCFLNETFARPSNYGPCIPIDEIAGISSMEDHILSLLAEVDSVYKHYKSDFSFEVDSFIRKWCSPMVPVLIVHREDEDPLTPVTDIYERYNQAASQKKRSVRRGNSCACSEQPITSRRLPFDVISSNVLVDQSRSYIRSTDHRRFFGLDDVKCGIHSVGPDTVNNLMRHDTHQTQANIETLIRHARTCAERMAADQDESRARSLIDRVENDIHKTRQLWEHFENTDCVSNQDFEELESALTTLQGWANECRFQDKQKPLPTIPVRFDGCFLPEKITVCGEEFLPGIYISDNPSTDPTELLYHELTHAYLHAHKQVYINCPWIEEGLAELCGKLWQGAASGRPTLDPSEYADFEPKNSLYYNFLEEVIGMRPESIQELFQDYTGTNPSPKPNLDWCNKLIRPYCL